MIKEGSFKSEISMIRDERESLQEQIKTAKSPLKMINSQYDQKQVNEIINQIQNVRDELSTIDLEKERRISEFKELDARISASRSELDSLNSQHESKKKEILMAKKELEFIEKELDSIGKKEDTKKIVEAAGSVLAAANAKYEAIKKEIDIVKTALARTKQEYESGKNELISLKGKFESKKIVRKS